ncbi:hypothetical protein ACFWFF_38610 [Streptomyces sp. NPDC060223]|uniref:hypothetical protein n=1 Tax=unclassified Streptomyces TaxID=2593676 RepID=UPI0036277428
MLLALAAAAEHPNEHPLARAVVDAARTRGLVIEDMRDLTTAPGIGVTATIEGHAVAVRALARLFDEIDDTLSARATEAAAGLEENGPIVVLVLRDCVPVGVLDITDRLRPDALAAVAFPDRAGMR